MKKSSNEKCKTRYNRLMTDLGYESKTIDTEYSEKPDDKQLWNIRDMVAETYHVLACYTEPGNSKYENRSVDKTTYKRWKSEKERLQKFIDKWELEAMTLSNTFEHENEALYGKYAVPRAEKHFFMVLDKDHKNNNNECHEGVNEGLEFHILTSDQLRENIQDGTYLCDVKVAEDSVLIGFGKMIGFNYIVADSITVSNIRPLNTIETIHEMESLGINIIDSLPDLFCIACACGNSKTAEWLYEQGEISAYDLEHAFQAACSNGYIEVAKWLYNTGKIDLREFVYYDDSDSIESDGYWLDKSLLNLACSLGQLDTVIWLHEIGYFDLIENKNEVFFVACKYGHLNIAKWLYGLGFANFNLKEEYEDTLFEAACGAGNMKLVKWLYNIGSVQDGEDISGAFFRALEHGNLEIAKWLYSFGVLDEDSFDSTLNYACKNLEVTKWVYSLPVFTGIGAEAFRNACDWNAVDTAKWLYSIGNVEDSDLYFTESYRDNFDVFTYACMQGHLELAKWLYSLGKFPLVTDNEYKRDIFCAACKHGHLELVKWLYSLGVFDIYDLGIENEYNYFVELIRSKKDIYRYWGGSEFHWNVNYYKVLKWCMSVSQQPT